MQIYWRESVADYFGRINGVLIVTIRRQGNKRYKLEGPIVTDMQGKVAHHVADTADSAKQKAEMLCQVWVASLVHNSKNQEGK